MSGFNAHTIKTVCEEKLEIKFRSSREFNGWFILRGKKVVRITVPKGRKSVHPKTFKSMAQQLKLSTDKFSELLECSYKKGMYERDLLLMLNFPHND